MSTQIGLPLPPGQRPLRIGFAGFHRKFPPVHNNIAHGLQTGFSLEIATDREIPDFLFFSVFGPDGQTFSINPHLIRREPPLSPPKDCFLPEAVHRAPRYDGCVKIFTSEENVRIPWSDCQYAMTGDRIVVAEKVARHLRLPIYARRIQEILDWTNRTIVKPAGRDPELVRRSKTRFCNFVYGNAKPAERRLFFEILSKYKKVDAAGPLLNNTGGCVGPRLADKLAYLDEYKFTIAFENSRHPGYVTEKIVDPMASSSIPIYWGDRRIAEDFNPKSFVDANEPEGKDLRRHFEEVVERVAHLDQNDAAYDAMVSEPWFKSNVPNEYCHPHYTHVFMHQIINSR